MRPSHHPLRPRRKPDAWRPPGTHGEARWVRERANSCLRRLFGAILAVTLIWLGESRTASSQEIWDSDPTRERVTFNDFGGVGLLQTRTARFQKDGQFAFGLALSDPYDRYALTWQILPWAEATFRYTSDDLVGISGLDRGADLKLQLFEETRNSPEIALGFQDALGTGRYDGEYLVASKRYGDLDVSLGVAWGYSVGKNGLFNNPFRLLSNSFKTRSSPGRRGGTLRANTYFAGPEIDLFGGVEYHTPLEGLSLKAEYDPNDYKVERGGVVDTDFPINVGVTYRPWEWLDLGLAFERGNTMMLRLSLRSDLAAEEWIPKIADEPAARAVIRPSTLAERIPGLTQQQDASQTASSSNSAAATTLDIDMLKVELRQQGLEYEDLEVAGRAAVLRVSVQNFALIEKKLRALAPVLVARVPVEVSEFRFLVRSSDGERREFSHRRAELANSWAVDTLFERLEAQQFQVMSIAIDARETTVEVKADMPRTEVDYLVAARAVGELLPGPGGTVRIVETRPSGARSTLDLKLADGSHVFAPRVEAAAPTVAVEDGPTSLSEAEVDAIAVKILDALEPQGLSGEAFALSRKRATIVVTPSRYRQVARNVGRAARAVASFAPPDIEEIAVVLRSGGVDVTRVVLMRRHLEDAELGLGSPEEIFQSARIDRPQDDLPKGTVIVKNAGLYPKLDWGVGTELRPHIGAPEDPFLFQFWARVSAGVELLPGLHLGTVLGKDIYNNFDKITRGPKGRLPHVRSNLKEYLQQGEDALVNLQADYVFSPAPDWFMRGAVGYFEMMFGGVSGEVLYRPQNARWAVGLELSHVRQREFEQRLGFGHYETTTGHLSLYYKLPWYGLEARVHAGRYLAGDIGATFQLARRFKGGIEVGGFVTQTDASAADFGEGSFDKGFFIRVPLDMFLPYSTRSSIGTLFRPLTSDGGQMLEVGPKLYDLTEEGQVGALDRDWHRLLD